MSLPRRTLLGLGAGASAAALLGCTGTEATETSRTTALWCWPGGLSEAVVADAVTEYAARTELRPRILTGDYLDQLSAVLARTGGAPAIAGVKGEDVASLMPRADRFVDLNTLGARDVAGTFLSWKLEQGATIDGRQVGLPIDIGPTALFYRADLFARAGLPAAPDGVSAALPTWETFLDAGETLCRALPGVRLLRNGAEVFSTVVSQANQRFVDESNHFVGDQPHVRNAWDLAVELSGRGLSAAIAPGDDDAWVAAMAAGTLATETGAAWHSADIVQAAPYQSGQWRVAAGPAAGASTGGSFLTIPTGGTDHDLAFEVIRWLLSAENQARNFTDAALFPAAPAAFDLPALSAPVPYFGDQITAEVFAASAERAPRAYEAPSDAGIGRLYLQQLNAVEAGSTTGSQGWATAVKRARKHAIEQGVN